MMANLKWSGNLSPTQLMDVQAQGMQETSARREDDSPDEVNMEPEKRQNKQLEKELQIACFDWGKRSGFLLCSVPSGATFAGNPVQRAIQSNAMRARGVSNGFPDMLIFNNSPAGHRGLAVELKIGRQPASACQVSASLPYCMPALTFRPL